jgi:hypothetical protein
MTFTVTQRFADANRALGPISAFNGATSTVQLVQDIQSRASEVEACRVGHELPAHQVEYLQCLRSRLQDYGLREVPAVIEWLAAFSEAYGAQVAA